MAVKISTLSRTSRVREADGGTRGAEGGVFVNQKLVKRKPHQRDALLQVQPRGYEDSGFGSRT